MKYNNRITINLNICHGKPCIRGMRWPVEVVLDMLISENDNRGNSRRPSPVGKRGYSGEFGVCKIIGFGAKY